MKQNQGPRIRIVDRSSMSQQRQRQEEIVARTEGLNTLFKNSFKCSKCLELLFDANILSCGHILCDRCSKKLPVGGRCTVPGCVQQITSRVNCEAISNFIKVASSQLHELANAAGNLLNVTPSAFGNEAGGQPFHFQAGPSAASGFALPEQVEPMDLSLRGNNTQYGGRP